MLPSNYDQQGRYFGIRKTFRNTGRVQVIAAAQIALLITNTSNRKLRLKSFKITDCELTAAQRIRFILSKYTALPTGGAPAAQNTTQAMDSSSSPVPSTGQVNLYTAAVTTAGTRGDLAEDTVGAVAPASLTPSNAIEFTFGEEGVVEMPTLNGATQGIGLFLPVAPATPLTFSYTVEWTEDNN